MSLTNDNGGASQKEEGVKSVYIYCQAHPSITAENLEMWKSGGAQDQSIGNLEMWKLGSAQDQTIWKNEKKREKRVREAPPIYHLQAPKTELHCSWCCWPVCIHPFTHTTETGRHTATDSHTCTHRDRQTGEQTDKHMDRWAGRQTENLPYSWQWVQVHKLPLDPVPTAEYSWRSHCTQTTTDTQIHTHTHARMHARTHAHTYK